MHERNYNKHMLHLNLPEHKLPVILTIPQSIVKFLSKIVFK